MSWAAVCSERLWGVQTGDTTVNQIRSMLEESSELPGAEEVQDVSFPSHLPPLRTEAPNSHIIRAVGV